MNPVDLWIGLAVTIFAFIGLKTGIFHTLASIILVYISTYFASFLAPLLAGAFTFLLVEEKSAGTVVLFVVVFLLVYLLGEFLLAVLKNIIKVTILGPLDRSGGFILGVFKGMLIVAVAFEIMMTLPLSEESLNAINRSMLRKWATQIFKTTYPLTLVYAPKVKDFFAERIGPAVVTVSSAEAVEAVSKVAEETKKVADKVRRSAP